MKNKFKKIVSVLGSVVMIGSTIGMAFAAGGAFPSPFVQNGDEAYAIVYGSGAAASDVVGANSINEYLNTFYTSKRTETVTTTSTTPVDSTSATSSDFSSSVSLSDEIELGLDDIIEGSKLRESIEDNKLSTLLDTKIRWDDGINGTESYDIHEEILLTNDGGDSKLKLVTNLYHADGEDFEYVVLQNDESLRYRLVFDDVIVYSDHDDEEELEVTILGKDYEITEFNNEFDDITISLSEERLVKKGETFIIDGTTITIEEIYEKDVQINGILIKDTGSVKKVDGLEIKVSEIISHPDSSLDKARIRIGKDIKRDISPGDEYIEDDETWEWDLGINNDGKQYIGVKYALKSVSYDEDEPEENPISVGESYIFPENYAALSFDGLTDVSYKDFDLSFDEKDLYSGDSSTRKNDINVAILEGEEGDSITLDYDDNDVETNSIYFEYVEGGVNVYFRDIDGDIDDKRRVQLAAEYTFSTGDVTTITPVAEEDVTILREPSTFEVTGYTYMDVYNLSEVDFMYDFGEEGGLEHIMYLYTDEDNILRLITDSIVRDNPGAIEAVTTEILGEITGYEFEGHTVIKEGDTYFYEEITTETPTDEIYEGIATLIVKDTEIKVGLNLNFDGTVDLTLTDDNNKVTKISLGIDEIDEEFTHLGGRADNADSNDIIVDGKPIGTVDYDVMDNYGTIIKDPENYADDDRIVFSVPDEQILATVSIKGQGEIITSTTTANVDVNGTNATTYTTTTEVPIMGGILVKDTEISSVQDKNLIIVGGSCINAETARLLGGKACGEDFTLKTGIVAGKALVQTFASPYDASKVAVVVAGYNAADTTRAINAIINSDINIDLDQRIIV